MNASAAGTEMRIARDALWLLLIVSSGILSPIRGSNAELIKALPGQNPSAINFKQYSGYVATDTRYGRALFYYFLEADVADDPLSHPLTLWFNGGPGCSSLGGGAFMENGPFRVGNDGILIPNRYSWNLVSNMLYVESPIGVGFSYSNTSSDYIGWNDSRTAAENLKFILNWLEKFPKYKGSDIYLTGESYAGHYVPQLAALIVEYNKLTNTKPIKLKAIALGNPLLDMEISLDSADYLWSHGVISHGTWKLLKTCNLSRVLGEMFQSQSSFPQECKEVYSRVDNEIGPDIDRDDLLMPKCLSARTVQQSIYKGIHAMIQNESTNGDPCLEGRVDAYLNKPQVQKALHATDTSGIPHTWGFCLGPLQYQREDLFINIIPLVEDLLQKGIPVLLYSGDQDTKIPLTQTRIIANILAEKLKLSTLTSYGPWYDGKQVAGWTQSFGEAREGKRFTLLTFATVRGGSHLVPFTSPSEALTLFKAFLNQSPLPLK